MANGRVRRRSIFGGVLLILLGVLFLVHNFRGGFPLWDLLARWWPLLLILWGFAKLFDYLLARQTGQAISPTITGGEIFLVLVLLALVAMVAGIEHVHQRGPFGEVQWPPWGNPYSFSQELPAQPAPANARVDIYTGRGDITVMSGDSPQIRVVARKTAYASDENEAKRDAQTISVEVTPTGGSSFQIRPQGQGTQGNRVEVDLEVHLPKQASVNAQTEHGNVHISGIQGSVSTEALGGDVEVRDVGSDVTVDTRRGDVHLVGAKGNVKLSGRGGQVEIANVGGEAAIEGEFYGPIRVEKVAKGARFLSQRTDLTVTQLVGKFETGSGSLTITDSPGNVTLTTRKYDVVLENVTGRVQIENRDGDVELRFPQPPRAEINVTDSSGNIELTMPANSSFQISAESRSGDIDCEFSQLAPKATEQRGSSRLEGQIGARGPQIRLQTTYGTIRLRKTQPPQRGANR